MLIDCLYVAMQEGAKEPWASTFPIQNLKTKKLQSKFPNHMILISSTYLRRRCPQNCAPNPVIHLHVSHQPGDPPPTIPFHTPGVFRGCRYWSSTHGGRWLPACLTKVHGDGTCGNSEGGRTSCGDDYKTTLGMTGHAVPTWGNSGYFLGVYSDLLERLYVGIWWDRHVYGAVGCV
jgi:hypothetical protein